MSIKKCVKCGQKMKVNSAMFNIFCCKICSVKTGRLVGTDVMIPPSSKISLGGPLKELSVYI